MNLKDLKERDCDVMHGCLLHYLLLKDSAELRLRIDVCMVEDMNRYLDLGIAIGCGLEDRDFGVRVPVQSRFLISQCPDRLFRAEPFSRGRQLCRNFQAFYETRKFITVFTRTIYLSLS
jgi:hypothetical protein